MNVFSKIVIEDSSVVVAIACTVCVLLLLHRLIVKIGAFARNEPPLSPGVLPASQLRFGQSKMKVVKVEKSNNMLSLDSEGDVSAFSRPVLAGPVEEQQQQQQVARRTPKATKRFDTTEALDQMFNRVDEIASQFNSLQNTLDSVNNAMKSPASAILGSPSFPASSPSLRPAVSPFHVAPSRLATIEDAETDSEDEEVEPNLKAEEERLPVIFNKTRSVGSVRFFDQPSSSSADAGDDETIPEPVQPRRKSFIDPSLFSRPAVSETPAASAVVESGPVAAPKRTSVRLSGRKSMAPVINRIINDKENEGDVNKMLKGLKSAASKDAVRPQRKSLAPKRTTAPAVAVAPRKVK